MKRIVKLIFYMLLVLLGLLFAVLNAQKVSLDFYFGSYDGISLAMIMFLAMVIGAGIGFLFCLGQLISARREINKLKKSIQLAEKEVTNLRTIPIKDNH